jgi:chaperone modulatory protein CbpM
MTDTLVVEMRVEEICAAAGIPTPVLIEIVEQGIIVPAGTSPRDWLFDTRAVALIKRACRLQRDLDIEWAGVALAMELLGELDRLRAENQLLRRQLKRFTQL